MKKRWYVITVKSHDGSVFHAKKMTTYQDAIMLPIDLLQTDQAEGIKYIYLEEIDDAPPTR